MAENIAIPYDLECELIQMRNIIGLATFAAEARRVLRDVDLIADQIPHIGAALGIIEARCQWSEYPDTLASVLDDVYDRLGGLMGRA